MRPWSRILFYFLTAGGLLGLNVFMDNHIVLNPNTITNSITWYALTINPRTRAINAGDKVVQYAMLKHCWNLIPLFGLFLPLVNKNKTRPINKTIPALTAPIIPVWVKATVFLVLI